MRILLVKTSSLGDIIHTFPAITDALRFNPSISIDWIVEESFVELLKLYRSFIAPIPVGLRRWRVKPFASKTWQQISHFRQQIKAADYDLILDAQGLMKSACLILGSKARRVGMDFSSCREPWAALTYHQRFPVARNQHAVLRVRELMAKALAYAVPESEPDYGVKFLESDFPLPPASEQYVLFVHGSSWPEKAWPVMHWQNLARRLNDQGYKVKLPWGNASELQHAQAIAKAGTNTEVLGRLNLFEMAGVIYQSSAVVAVDTGLAHLAAAMHKPCVSLYLVTSPLLTGCYGQHQVHLAVQGQETPYIKYLLSQKIRTPIKPLYLDFMPDDGLVYAQLHRLMQAG